MSIVIIGDIGWRNHYHLGDDAMTEAAIEQLRLRGHEDLILTAGDPDAATELYGLPAVPRFGFSGRWDRARSLAWLDRVVDEADRTHPAIAAIASSEALLIAGGGNLNSRYFHLALDRLCAVRLARRFDVTVFVSSQTVGPFTDDVDEALVIEIARSARLFGARDTASHRLISRHTPVTHTMDDAAALSPSPLAPPTGRYIVGSFAPNPEGSGLTDVEYIDQIAHTLDRLSTELDADVVLIPHMGPLHGDPTGVDQRVHAEIIGSTKSGRVRATGIMMARDAISHTAHAILSISTRYHPVVFAPMVGTPAIGIALNYYSSIRMRGALENTGLSAFVAPAETWFSGGVEAMAVELAARADEFAEHIAGVRSTRERELRAWWDAISSEIRGAATTPAADLTPAAPFPATGGWHVPLEQVTRVSDLLGLERLTSERQSQRINELDSAMAELSSTAASLRENLDSLQRDRDSLGSELEAHREQLAAAHRALTRSQRDLEIRDGELERALSRRAVRLADAAGRQWRRLRGIRT